MPGSPGPASRSWPRKGCCFSNLPLPSLVPAHLPSPCTSVLVGLGDPSCPSLPGQHCAYCPPGWKPGSGPHWCEQHQPKASAQRPWSSEPCCWWRGPTCCTFRLRGSQATNLSQLEGQTRPSGQRQSGLRAGSPCGLSLGSCPAGDRCKRASRENSDVCFQKLAP